VLILGELVCTDPEADANPAICAGDVPNPITRKITINLRKWKVRSVLTALNLKFSSVYPVLESFRHSDACHSLSHCIAALLQPLSGV
jgi:hypothetical protein